MCDESAQANQTITSAISALYRLGGGDVGAAETSDVIKAITEAGVKRVSGIEEVDPEALSNLDSQVESLMSRAPRLDAAAIRGQLGVDGRL